MVLGDSKSLPPPSNTWQGTLVTNLTSASPGFWSYNTTAFSSTSVATMASSGSRTSQLIQYPPYATGAVFLINLGRNDMGPIVLAEATFEADYELLLDDIHTRWPDAICYLTRPWGTGLDTDADTLATWIGVVQSARSIFTRLGDDERVWFKPNVLTYSGDGTHWTLPAGQTAKAAATQTAIGF